MSKSHENITNEVREKVRRAVAMIERRGESVSNRSVRPLAGVDTKVCATLLRLYKKGDLPDPGTEKGGVGAWRSASRSSSEGDDEDRRSCYAAALRAATTDEERGRLQHELAALTSEGVFTSAEAQAIRQALAGAMGHDKAAREAPDEEARRQRVVAGPEAYALVRAFEGIVSDERRERVLRFVASEFSADLAEHPPVDSGRAS